MGEGHSWFDISEIEEGIFVLREGEHVQSYLVKGKKRSALIDTGMGFRDIRAVAEELAGNEIVVLNTHWHFDHIGGNALFEKIGIAGSEAPLIERPISNAVLTELYIRPFSQEGVAFPEGFSAETYEIRESRASFFPRDGDRMDLGGRWLEVLATPGHTRGSLSFLDGQTRTLICGDFLYPGTLYAHFEDSDVGAYAASLERILARDGRIGALYGGHNAPRIPEGFPEDALSGFRRVQAGARPDTVLHEWGEPVDLHDFGEIRILAKHPGSSGVGLARHLHGTD